jgi:hypothetical protein
MKNKIVTIAHLAYKIVESYQPPPFLLQSGNPNWYSEADEGRLTKRCKNKQNVKEYPRFVIRWIGMRCCQGPELLFLNSKGRGLFDLISRPHKHVVVTHKLVAIL